MAKGGSFEREVAVDLTKWLTGKKKPYVFWRMPGSGGLATIHEECVDLSGDIRSLKPYSEFMTNRFSIECKTGYPRTNFWQLFKKIKHFDIKDFWMQTCRDAEKAGKYPMLIFRKLGQKKVVCIRDLEDLSLTFEISELRNLPTLTVRFGCELPPMVVYDFVDFFKLVCPDDIKKLQVMPNPNWEI
jgi:hypothetical protein